VLDKVFEEGHDEIVLIRDIPFSSLRAPPRPVRRPAHVGYIPNRAGQVTGLSKLARLVDLVAKRPEPAGADHRGRRRHLEEVLEPRGSSSSIEAEHFCMTMRGVRKPGAMTVTSAVRGIMRDDPATRAEAMALINAPGRRTQR
jgi:GTP cyclohydrolase IA